MDPKTDPKKEPNQRFLNFEEQYDCTGKAVGFTITDTDFLFYYESDGGWYDEDGNYYDADGILQPEPSNHGSDNDSYDNDDALVDEFEQILLEEESGIIPHLPQPKEKKQGTDVFHRFQVQIDKYKKQENVKTGLIPILFIYFKMRSNCWSVIKPEVENKKSVADKNAYVKEMKQKNQAERDSLEKNNPWLKEKGVLLDFSGVSLNENIYHRYWYGSIRCYVNTYIDMLKNIKGSKEFGLLEDRSYYALKSKFQKKEMEELINEHSSKVKSRKADYLIKVTLRHLPINFSLSFVYDLVDFCGGKAEDVLYAKITGEDSVVIQCSQPTALLVANLYGYKHDKGYYIELDFYVTEKTGGYIKFLQVRLDDKCSYKISERELFDTLLFEQGPTEILKIYEKTEMYRFAVGLSALRRLLMYRGNTINVNHIVAEVKK